MILGNLFGIPCVADLQGSLTKELSDYKFAGRNRIVYGMLKAVEGWVDRGSDHVIVSSDAMISDLRDRFNVPSERITLVKDGVGRGFFEPPDEENVRATRRELGIREGDRVVVFLGVLTRLQGVEILMDAIPRVLDERDDISFLVIGFPGHEDLARRFAETGCRERVIFPGRMPYLEISEALAIADLALSPKISETEGNGKLFNYMAASLPTIVFDNKVNREILGDDGIYLGDRAPDVLAGAILEALDDGEEIAGRGSRLRERAREQASWSQNRTTMEAVYRRAIGPKSAGDRPAPAPPPADQKNHTTEAG